MSNADAYATQIIDEMCIPNFQPKHLTYKPAPSPMKLIGSIE